MRFLEAIHRLCDVRSGSELAAFAGGTSRAASGGGIASAALAGAILRVALASAMLMTLPSCSSLRKIEITSFPPGASVKAIDGSVLGQTPLTLTSGLLDRATMDGRLAIVLWAPGHIERELLLEENARDRHEVRLTPQGPDTFRTALVTDYAAEANSMTRDLLGIHGLILARKAAEAERRIIEFQKTYPSIAASWVMRAQLLLKQGKSEDARTHLLRALTLDPYDPVASRGLLGKAAPLRTPAAAPAGSEPSSGAASPGAASPAASPPDSNEPQGGSGTP